MYNFKNDNILVTFNISKSFYDKVIEYINHNIERFEKYIYENYSRYDGFISFYPNDYKVWIKKHLNYDDIDNYCFSSALAFIIMTYYSKINEDIYYELYHRTIKDISMFDMPYKVVEKN